MEGKVLNGENRTRLPFLFWVFWLVGGILLCLTAIGAFHEGVWIGLKAISVAAGFIVLAPLIWGLCDWLRQVAMPTMFFSRGFFDTLGKRLFWAIGPQAIGMCLAFVVSFFLLGAIVSSSSSKSEVIKNSISEKTPTPNTPLPAQELRPQESRPMSVAQTERKHPLVKEAQPPENSSLASGSEVESRYESEVREQVATKIIPGKCLLEVEGTVYIDGRCLVRMEANGDFQIDASSDDEPLTYFATVSITSRGVGKGFWNEERGASHAQTPLGVLRKNGACWENAAAKVCAEKNVDPSAPHPSSKEQALASQEDRGARLTEVDYKTELCPTTFEQGRWSYVENDHGLVMTATDGEKLYVGSACDVISSRFGDGRWMWLNGDVRFQFGTCHIIWPHTKPPIEDGNCLLTP